VGTLRRCVAFSPDGRWLVSSGFDRQVLVWDVAGGRLRCAFPSHDSVTITIAFHPSGELLATGDNDHEVRLWDVAPVALGIGAPSGAEARGAVRLRAVLRGHIGVVEAVRFSSDGPQLYSGSTDETIQVWDVATGVWLRILRAEEPYAGMDITGATGLSDEQRAERRALGAVEAA
jgi:WD40 repeat protein